MTDNGQLVHMSMGACEKNNPGSRVALYLDETMRYEDGANFLPVMNIEGSSSYALFVPAVREAVADFFGHSYPDAQAKVGQINAERGLSHADVIEMVAESMGIASRRR